METQSAIPKSDEALTMDQLRNLSCTNALSKVLETFVLDRLREEVSLKPNQFGGVRGSGTNHFLIETWNKIMTALDTPETAVGLLSIDFNRMDHTACVAALARYGASTEMLKMVASFLSCRRMRFKVNSTLSTERPVLGGSPQGTKLGNYLFVVTINAIEEGQHVLPPAMTDLRDRENKEDDSDQLRLRHIAGRVCTLRRFNSGVAVASTPHKLGATDGVFRYFNKSGRNNTTIADTSLPRQMVQYKNEIQPWTDKYMDDVNIGERLSLLNAVSTFSQHKEKKMRIRASECERLFKVIFKNVTELGMRVNWKKTQLLCITAAVNSDVTAYVQTDEELIESSESMTLLGFRFSSKPTVTSHIDSTRTKFNSHSWIIRHLKQAGVKDIDLVKIFATVIRPVIEYAAPVYHPMLNGVLT